MHGRELPAKTPTEDNAYDDHVTPCLEFVLTSGALVVLNNEKGFEVRFVSYLVTFSCLMS